MPGSLSSTGNWVVCFVVWDSEGFTCLGHTFSRLSTAHSLKPAIFLEEEVFQTKTSQCMTKFNGKGMKSKILRVFHLG